MSMLETLRCVHVGCRLFDFCLQFKLWMFFSGALVETLHCSHACIQSLSACVCAVLVSNLFTHPSPGQAHDDKSLMEEEQQTHQSCAILTPQKRPGFKCILVLSLFRFPFPGEDKSPMEDARQASTCAAHGYWFRFIPWVMPSPLRQARPAKCPRSAVSSVAILDTQECSRKQPMIEAKAGQSLLRLSANGLLKKPLSPSLRFLFIPFLPFLRPVFF